MELTSSTNKTQELDAPLYTIGFEIDELSPEKVTGRLPVTPKCCQVLRISLLLIFFFLWFSSFNIFCNSRLRCYMEGCQRWYRNHWQVWGPTWRLGSKGWPEFIWVSTISGGLISGSLSLLRPPLFPSAKQFRYYFLFVLPSVGKSGNRTKWRKTQR